MCRNIRTLFNFEPAATDDEVRAASLQFVRKISGFTKPSKANEAAFELAVDRVSAVAQELLNSLVTTAEPKNRDIEAERAKARASVFMCPVYHGDFCDSARALAGAGRDTWNGIRRYEPSRRESRTREARTPWKRGYSEGARVKRARSPQTAGPKHGAAKNNSRNHPFRDG